MKVIQNAIDIGTHYPSGHLPNFNKQLVAITEKVVEMFPDLIDDANTMSAPADTVNGVLLQSQIHPLAARFVFSHVADMSNMVDDLALQIGGELTSLKSSLQAEGKTWCPFVIAIPAMTTDNRNFSSMLVFQTSYGVA